MPVRSSHRAALGRASPYFDIDGDGWTEQTAWVTGGDGLLVRDFNGNGTIDGLAELFGTETESGFAALGALDGNADGLIDANDAAYLSLRVWVGSDDAFLVLDENGNGHRRPIARRRGIRRRGVDSRCRPSLPIRQQAA